MTANWILGMSKEEINHIEILRMANEKRITQRKGAERIEVTPRHLRRLLRRYRDQM